MTDANAADEPTLEQLEADIAAVEAAMSSLERIAAEVADGDAAAAEVAAVVSPQRFPVAEQGPPAG